MGGVDFCHRLSPHFLDIYPDTATLTVVWANVSASLPSDPHQLGTCVVSSLWYLAGVHPRGCGAASVTANVNRNPKNSIYDAVSSVRFWAVTGTSGLGEDFRLADIRFTS